MDDAIRAALARLIDEHDRMVLYQPAEAQPYATLGGLPFSWAVFLALDAERHIIRTVSRCPGGGVVYMVSSWGRDAYREIQARQGPC